jgi:hypothetical protein
MKISFNQTYGDARKQLFDIRFKDRKFIELLSFFDINIFSFHNCHRDIVEYFKANCNIPNSKIFINNGISYTDCIRRMRDTIKYLNTKYFLFYQDDTFSFDNDGADLNSLLSFVFKQEDVMLNLYEKRETLGDLPLIQDNIFQCDTFTFARHNKWAFDDSPYICSANYIPLIYDDTYLKYGDVWSAEHYLNAKFKQVNMKRLVTGRSLFKNYNFIGRNIQNKENEFKVLTQKGLM